LFIPLFFSHINPHYLLLQRTQNIEFVYHDILVKLNQFNEREVTIEELIKSFRDLADSSSVALVLKAACGFDGKICHGSLIAIDDFGHYETYVPIWLMESIEVLLLWIEFGLPINVSIYPASRLDVAPDDDEDITRPPIIPVNFPLFCIVASSLHHPKLLLDLGAVVFVDIETANPIFMLCSMPVDTEDREKLRVDQIKYLIQKRGFLRVLTSELDSKEAELRREAPSKKVLSLLDSGLVQAKVSFLCLFICMCFFLTFFFLCVCLDIPAVGSTRGDDPVWIGRCRQARVPENVSCHKKSFAVTSFALFKNSRLQIKTTWEYIT